MKVGMNLLFWTPRVDDSLYPAFEQLREIGFDGVEVPLASEEREHCVELAGVLSDLGLERTGVLHLDDDADPIHEDAAVRRNAVATLRNAIENAVALGATHIGGPLHSAYKLFRGRGPTNEEFDRAAEVLGEAADFAREHGITLAIEPLNRFECYACTTVAEARQIVDRADRPNLGVLYDTHHLHLEEKNVRDAITRGGERILHVHISESDRGTPGTGQVHWGDTFAGLRALGYDGWLTIEAFTRRDPGFAGAIHVWRDYDDVDALPKSGYDFIQRSWASA